MASVWYTISAPETAAWSLLIYSLIQGQGAVLFAMSSGIKKRAAHRGPRPWHLEPSCAITSSPISLPPNNSWSTEWHRANKAPISYKLTSLTGNPLIRILFEMLSIPWSLLRINKTISNQRALAVPQLVLQGGQKVGRQPQLRIGEWFV